MKRKIKNVVNAKKRYMAPSIASQSIELEHGIASGSATTNPGTSADPVREEWGTGTNRDGNLDW